VTGKGVVGHVEGRIVAIGNTALLADLGAQVTSTAPADDLRRNGETVMFVAVDGAYAGLIGVADRIKETTREAIAALHEEGLRIVMLTGDSRVTAEAVARAVGIDTVEAEVLPEQKAATIRELQERGNRVAMVGDGVNDAPALVTADVGIAIGAGTDVAVEAGDVVLVRNDPRDVARIIELSRASYRKMTQNLWWAAGYNILAIPLAAGVLAPRGVVLAPAVGAVLMSASTVIVALNAQLLRRVELD